MESLTDEQLVERVAWGIHASRGHGSPRQLWAAMSDAGRAALMREAEGAIAAYERYRSAEGIAEIFDVPAHLVRSSRPKPAATRVVRSTDRRWRRWEAWALFPDPQGPWFLVDRTWTRVGARRLLSDFVRGP